MKKWISLSMVMLIAGIAAASHGASRFSLKLWNNSQAIVIMDGVKSSPTNHFVLDDIRPGEHRLKVIKRIKKYDPYQGYVTKRRVMFDGVVHIPAHQRIRARIDNRGRYEVISSVARHNHGHGGRNGYYSDRNNCNGGNYIVGTGGSCSGGVDRYYADDYCDGGTTVVGCHGAAEMNRMAFDNLLMRLHDTSFDSEKMRIVKRRIARQGVLSSRQLQMLAMEFSFDSYKLELAKFGSGYVSDRQNLYRVGDTFSFDSTRARFNRYLANRC